MIRRLPPFGLALLVALGSAAGPEAPRDVETLTLSSEFRIRVLHGRDLELEVRVAAGDDWSGIAARLADSSASGADLAAWNRRETLAEGDWVRLPVGLLSESMRSLVLRRMFPEDRVDGEDWLHVARAGGLPTYDEGLWQIASWFTGQGDRFAEIQRFNGLAAPELGVGQSVRVPAGLLLPCFRRKPTSDDGSLEYESDAQGAHAIYRLRDREALYSAVVVRYTGRTLADDVLGVAKALAERSGIRDARDIPVGYPVVIPFEMLEPEFLPAEHPRRREAEAARKELERELEQRPVDASRTGLDGVIVVIDPGHGGRDLGTMNHGIWEHDYVYDVACRLRRLLESESAARVVMTLVDDETGCEPSDANPLVANRRGSVQTSPPFLAREDGDANVGVNLRWYLANSIFRRAVNDSVAHDRVVFVSLHADARHPSLRGLMVYVPGAAYRTRTYGEGGAAYHRYDEVRERTWVKFSRAERVRSEAVSRRLADAIVASFREAGLPVQPFQPIRDKVIRGKSPWLPAVLRGNEVPTKVLIELINMSNGQDASLLASGRDRERLARGVLNGLRRHFGEPSPRQTAARRAAP